MCECFRKNIASRGITRRDTVGTPKNPCFFRTCETSYTTSVISVFLAGIVAGRRFPRDCWRQGSADSPRSREPRGIGKKENELVIDLRAVHEDRLDPLGLTILVMPQGFSRFQAFRNHASQRVTFFPLKLQQVFQGT